MFARLGHRDIPLSDNHVNVLNIVGVEKKSKPVTAQKRSSILQFEQVPAKMRATMNFPINNLPSTSSGFRGPSSKYCSYPSTSSGRSSALNNEVHRRFSAPATVTNSGDIQSIAGKYVISYVIMYNFCVCQCICSCWSIVYHVHTFHCITLQYLYHSLSSFKSRYMIHDTHRISPCTHL